MDFSPLTEALSSKSYEKIADICDNLMLQVAAEGIVFQKEWPYAIHLLGHIYVDDIARFLWKSIPSEVKEGQPEVVATWKIGQKLWIRDYAGVHEAIRGFNWSPETQALVAAFSDTYTRKMFQLLLAAYSIISVQDAALFLGMNEDDTRKSGANRGDYPKQSRSRCKQAFEDRGLPLMDIVIRCFARGLDIGPYDANANRKEAFYCDRAEAGSK